MMKIMIIITIKWIIWIIKTIIYMDDDPSWTIINDDYNKIPHNHHDFIVLEDHIP